MAVRDAIACSEGVAKHQHALQAGRPLAHEFTIAAKSIAVGTKEIPATLVWNARLESGDKPVRRGGVVFEALSRHEDDGPRLTMDGREPCIQPARVPTARECESTEE